MTKGGSREGLSEEVSCSGINRDVFVQNPLTELSANALLQVGAVLHATLELDPLLRCFSREVGAVIPHSGIHYANEDDGVELTHGRNAKYTFTCRLKVMEAGLGRLTFFRGKPFLDKEISILKYLFCALAYPLRNALFYLKAVRASITDPLTGVYNRTVMEGSLRREVALFKRHKIPLSLLVLDIDRFKAINDEYGHEMGDTILVTVTDRISSCLRKTDILSRYGGDEFVILLGNTNKKGAKAVARHICKEIEDKDYLKKAAGLKLAVSIGIASLDRGENSKRLFKRADQALYKAKREGGGRFKVAS